MGQPSQFCDIPLPIGNVSSISSRVFIPDQVIPTLSIRLTPKTFAAALKSAIFLSLCTLDGYYKVLINHTLLPIPNLSIIKACYERDGVTRNGGVYLDKRDLNISTTIFPSQVPHHTFDFVYNNGRMPPDVELPSTDQKTRLFEFSQIAISQIHTCELLKHVLHVNEVDLNDPSVIFAIRDFLADLAVHAEDIMPSACHLQVVLVGKPEQAIAARDILNTAGITTSEYWAKMFQWRHGESFPRARVSWASAIVPSAVRILDRLHYTFVVG